MSNATSTDRGWNFDIESQHVVTPPRIFGRDIDLVRRMTWEAMMTVGIIVDYYKCTVDNSDFYQDPMCSWDAAVQVDAVFDDNPKVKLLKDLGWFTEDDEIRPLLLYLPMYSDWTNKTLLDVKANSLIKINYFGQTTPQEFRITDRKLDSVYGCYYVCKLAPERLDNFVKVQKEGSYYLKRDDTRTDECAHAVETDTDAAQPGYEPDQRVFHHSDFDDYSSKIMG